MTRNEPRRYWDWGVSSQSVKELIQLEYSISIYYRQNTKAKRFEI